MFKLTKISLMVALVLSFTSSAGQAPDLQLKRIEALKSLEHENLSKARATFKELVEQGDPVAAYNLAVLEQERGGKPEYVLELLRFAADSGVSQANNNLGSLYERGQYVFKSLEKALSFYQRAAYAGLPEAQYNAGRILLMPHAHFSNKTKGIEHLQNAAYQGLAEAMFLLSEFMATDIEYASQSIGWLKKAADHSHPKAQYKLAVGYLGGLWGLPKNPKLGVYWLSKSNVVDSSGLAQVNPLDFISSGVTAGENPLQFSAPPVQTAISKAPALQVVETQLPEEVEPQESQVEVGLFVPDAQSYFKQSEVSLRSEPQVTAANQLMPTVSTPAEATNAGLLMAQQQLAQAKKTNKPAVGITEDDFVITTEPTSVDEVSAKIAQLKAEKKQREQEKLLQQQKLQELARLQRELADQEQAKKRAESELRKQELAAARQRVKLFDKELTTTLAKQEQQVDALFAQRLNDAEPELATPSVEPKGDLDTFFDQFGHGPASYRTVPHDAEEIEMQLSLAFPKPEIALTVYTKPEPKPTAPVSALVLPKLLTSSTPRFDTTELTKPEPVNQESVVSAQDKTTEAVPNEAVSLDLAMQQDPLLAFDIAEEQKVLEPYKAIDCKVIAPEPYIARSEEFTYDFLGLSQQQYLSLDQFDPLFLAKALWNEHTPQPLREHLRQVIDTLQVKFKKGDGKLYLRPEQNAAIVGFVGKKNRIYKACERNEWTLVVYPQKRPYRFWVKTELLAHESPQHTASNRG